MLNNLQKINNCKERYKIISNEIKKLHRLSPITKSGAEKRKAIPKLQEEQAKIISEFDSLAEQVKEWVKTFPSGREIYGEIVLKHYCDFSKNSSKLQDTVGECGLDMTASNFRADIYKIWLEEIKNR